MAIVTTLSRPIRDFSEAETQMPQVHTPKTDDSQEKTDDSQETQDSQKVELSEPRLKAFKAALLEVFVAG